MSYLLNESQIQFLWLLLAFPTAWILQSSLIWVLDRLFKRKHWLSTTQDVRDHLKPSLFFLFAIILLNGAIPFLNLPEARENSVYHIAEVAEILGWTWALVKVINLFKEVLFTQLHQDVSNNLRARKVRTQFEYLEKIAVVALIGIGIAMTLMTFDSARKIGSSLLASAGLAGVIFGFAAQKPLGNLVAGLQIAFTQPIRIDDVVVVEGEWGRIEEITLTYVVVKIWDLRRLILPITYFIEKPIQNWTRSESNLLGYVFLSLDYVVPMNTVREEFLRILQRTPLWDGTVSGVQVTDSTERGIQVRFLMGARNSSESFDLRCFVREEMTTFLLDHHPESFVRWRISEIATQRRTSELEKPLFS